MGRVPFDVVITDMRMPGMTGAQLLELVKDRFPRTVRMILSGQSDRETILRSIGPTHQYLSKPCDIEEVKHKLERAFALRDLLDNPRLKEIVSRMETVPSLPSLYVASPKPCSPRRFRFRKSAKLLPRISECRPRCCNW